MYVGIWRILASFWLKIIKYCTDDCDGDDGFGLFDPKSSKIKTGWEEFFSLFCTKSLKTILVGDALNIGLSAFVFENVSASGEMEAGGCEDEEGSGSAMASFP